MIFESAKYTKDFPINTTNVAVSAIIDGVLVSIPMDPANRHYAEIMRQVDAGTLTIAPAEEE